VVVVVVVVVGVGVVGFTVSPSIGCSCGQPGHKSGDCRSSSSLLGGRYESKPEAPHHPSSVDQPGHSVRSSYHLSPVNPTQQAEVDVAVAPPRRPVQCLQCLQYGHMARDCPNPRVCHRCAEPGHESWQCPHPVLVLQGPLAQNRRSSEATTTTQDAITSRSSNTANIQCLQCLQFGHIARNCPNARACHRCGQPGHESRMCPSSGYQVRGSSSEACQPSFTTTAQ
ncbi:hypothetical protein FOZ63_014618, partial [Perkinsus olseni]